VPFVCFSFSLQTREVRNIDSLSCADGEGHWPRIVGALIPYVYSVKEMKKRLSPNKGL
jgi:hypothetical protein